MKRQILSLIFLLPLFLTCCMKEESVWSRPVTEKRFTEAVIYCSKLKENGVSDWQLPTTDELSSFNEIIGNYWSSDTVEELNKNKDHDNEEDKAWFYDFSAKKKTQSFVSTRMNVICTRNVDEKQAATIRHNVEKDENACKSAREESKKNDIDPWIKYMQKFRNGMCIAEAEKAVCKYLENNNDEEKNDDDEKRHVYVWTEYLKMFPNGKCAKEAEDAKEFHIYKKRKGPRESALYQKAKERNTRAAWEKYLREFETEHIFEAKYRHDKMKKETTGYLEWSDRSDKRITWQDAPKYCEELDEDGSGWRLPDIDELRLLIKNRETATGGACKVSNECLRRGENNGCWTWKSCAETCKTHSFEDCDKYDDGRFSKIGDDIIWLWASSAPPNSQLHAWSVDFRDGHIGLRLKSDAIFVRCVR